MSKQNKNKVQLMAILEILKSGYWYDKKVESVLRPFGISHEQFNVLRILEHNHPRPYSLKEIQSRLMNQTANTTRLVEKLKLKKLVNSSYSKTNRRMLEISITESGINLLVKINTPLFELASQVDSVLNNKDAELLIKILRNFRKAS
jgi:DNA-binding MarR family transcriptional regulator